VVISEERPGSAITETADDLELRPPPMTSTSTRPPTHTSPVTSDFKMVDLQWTCWRGCAASHVLVCLAVWEEPLLLARSYYFSAQLSRAEAELRARGLRTAAPLPGPAAAGN
jgi:hypothetical protein